MSDSKAFGGTIPGFYDRYLGPFLFSQFALNMAIRIERMKPKRVLEVACGTGIVTKALAHLLESDTQIIATDLSPEMVEFARGSVNQVRIDFRVADAMNVPFASESFDVVACQFGMMMLPDKFAGAREAHRVLRSGGSFVFSVWGPIKKNPWSQILEDAFGAALPDSDKPFMPTPFSLADPELLREIAASAPFESVSIEEVEFQSPEIPVHDLATGFVHGTLISRHIQNLGLDETEVLDGVTRCLQNQVGALASSSLHAYVVTAIKR